MLDCVELGNLDVIESLGMIKVCYTACYCCWLSDSTALERIVKLFWKPTAVKLVFLTL